MAAYCVNCGVPLGTPAANASRWTESGRVVVAVPPRPEATSAGSDLTRVYGDPSTVEARPDVGDLPRDDEEPEDCTRYWRQPAADEAAHIFALRRDGRPALCWTLAPGECLARSEHDSTQVVPTVDGLFVEDHTEWTTAYVLAVGSVRLRRGDVFRIGNTDLEFVGAGVRILNGPRKNHFLYADDGELRIGRADVGDGRAARHHCRLVEHADGIYLEDLLTENGTFLRIRSGATIGYGQILLLGDKLVQAVRAAAA